MFQKGDNTYIYEKIFRIAIIIRKSVKIITHKTLEERRCVIERFYTI